MAGRSVELEKVVSKHSTEDVTKRDGDKKTRTVKFDDTATEHVYGNAGSPMSTEMRKKALYDLEHTMLSRNNTLIGRIDSSRSRVKLGVAVVAFLVVVLLGGGVIIALERPHYNEVVEEDLEFIQRLQTALNNTALFDELETKYQPNWYRKNPWNWSEATFYWISVMTTIGYGNNVPRTDGGKVWTFLFGFISIIASSVIIRILSSINADLMETTKYHQTHPGRKKWVILFLFLFFVTIFAILFSFVEDWTYLDSVYFVIITFTTVGFGDFVPEIGPAILLILVGIIFYSMVLSEAMTFLREWEQNVQMIEDILKDSEEDIKLTEVDPEKQADQYS